MFMSVSSILFNYNIWDLILPSKISMIHGVSVPCDWAPRYMCFIGWKNPKISHFCSLKSILLSMIHPLRLSFKVHVFYWMKNPKSVCFSHLNPFSSVWSMVLVSLAFELQGTYVLLNEKTRKVCALLLNFTLLKLRLELSNFPIYFLYINCANYLQCLSYPISSLLWLTPLILAALFILTAPSRMHQRLTGITTRMFRRVYLASKSGIERWMVPLLHTSSALVRAHIFHQNHMY